MPKLMSLGQVVSRPAGSFPVAADNSAVSSTGRVFLFCNPRQCDLTPPETLFGKVFRCGAESLAYWGRSSIAFAKRSRLRFAACLKQARVSESLSASVI
jgi:hypothetical protein